MSIKMKKYFIILIILLLGCWLKAYDPSKVDFASDYQFALYRSWLEYTNLPGSTPAGFKPDMITRIFTLDSGEVIDVEYDWKEHRIYNQREILKNKVRGDISPEKLFLLESLVYRINTADNMFIDDFLKITRIELFEDNIRIEKPREWLDKKFPEKIVVISIKSSDISSSQIILITDTMKITVLFPEKMIKIYDIFHQEPTLSLPIIIEPEIVIKEIETDIPLANYLLSRLNDPPRRELLQNKIKNPGMFLRQEFPHHTLNMDNNSAYLLGGTYEDVLLSNLALTFHRSSDGIEFHPDNNYRIEGNSIYFEDDESFYLPACEDHELDMIAPFLAQLIYEHRSIGTRLLNFLLIHDDVPTTVVIRTEERLVHEIDSYADLLLILNDHWKHRQIYFSLSEFKKVNNYIEFKGLLIAEDQNGDAKDSAEIWFHLNSDYRIDLIMMILFPNDLQED